MKSVYSIIRFINNPLSKENLAIGLILISKNKLYFKVSSEKVQLANKLSPDNFKLLEYTLDKIDCLIKNEIENNKYLFYNDCSFSKDYLQRLSVYNNGFLQFDKPVLVNLEFDENNFDNFFKKYIDLLPKKINKKIIDNHFKSKIKKVFSSPLEDVIDINIKIKKEQIPSLFFDYKLDGLGVNGVVYSVKSIDLNSDKPIDVIRKEISELETLSHRLDLFSKSQGYNKKDNKHYLVIDPYHGTRPSYENLYGILSEQNDNDYPYSVINTSQLEKVTSEIKNSNAKKFSEQFAMDFNDK